MDVLSTMLKALPLLLMTIIIEYRLANKTLGRKYSALFTLMIMLFIKFFVGWLNLYAHLLKSPWENTLYYGLVSFVLYTILFKGNFIKKTFIAVLMVFATPILFYIFLPFAHCFFSNEPQRLSMTLKVLEYFSLLLCGVIMEYVGKRFQNLRKELPPDYTIYLTAVIVFVCIAILSAYDRTLMIGGGSISFPSALTSFAFATIGTVIVGVAIFSVDRQVNVSLKEQLNVMQLENFKSREAEWQRFLGFRHDINNHLICLEGLLKNDRIEQAVSYMQNLTDTVKQFESPVQTGNDYADALLSVKYAQAKLGGIDILIEMPIPQEGFIEPVDLCCILSNAFDNAIAACNRLDEGEKWIKARSFIRQGQLVIEIENSKPSYVTVINNEVFPKEITSDHGLGLDNVKAVVNKYGGILCLSAADAFTFSLLLPQLRL